MTMLPGSYCTLTRARDMCFVCPGSQDSAHSWCVHLSFFLLETLYFMIGVSDHGGHAVIPPSCLDPTERPERGDLAGQ